jgi:hypothetical protein
VPIDIQTIDAGFIFDGAASAATADATITYTVGPTAGSPIFDRKRSDPPGLNKRQRDKLEAIWEDHAVSKAGAEALAGNLPTGSCNCRDTIWRSSTRPTLPGCRSHRCGRCR